VRSTGVDEITPGAFAINTSVAGGEVNPDSNPATLTIRNSHLSPVVGAQGIPIDGDQSQLVTFFASDGTTASATGTMHASGTANGPDVWFYTTHDTQLGDHLSAAGPAFAWEMRDHRTFPGNASGFVSKEISGSCTVSSSDPNKGICITVQLAGDNSGKWAGTYGMLELLQHKIYRIRANIIGSQSASGTANDVPLWDLIINNFDGGNGMNLYGMNYFFLDNTGRANAAAGTKVFQAYWCPSPLLTTRWNDPTAGVFSASNASYKDAFIEFRILDVSTGSTIGSENRTGSLCMEDLTIETMDDGVLGQVAATPYTLDPVTDAGTSVPGNGFTPSYDANGITMTPTSAGQTTSLYEVVPGDGNLSSIAAYADDYPVPMEAQKLYASTFMMDVPASADMDNPVDVFWVGADTPTNELICLTYVTGSGLTNTNPPTFSHVAMPTITAQPYTALFWSNNASIADTLPGSGPQLKAFRPRFMMGNNTQLSFNSNNSGKIRIRSIKVEEINAPQ